MITEINESKIVTKHVSSQYKYKHNGRKLNQKCNKHKCQREIERTSCM